MHGIEDLRERAAKAIDKKAAFGPDVDLKEFDPAPVPHTYLADEDMCELPPEEQKRPEGAQRHVLPERHLGDSLPQPAAGH